ncbi:hypothetical protein NDU88_003883 [Pleurodeles waltl]|uniref:Uncharacterized protein n=1 Tax=Pleurodeles waltl TaxID=8319 RepID=A0AAV7MSD7_PLEWA|nr:hypothetical protein NDU88_003883 [Pleurodeles waltl]
MPLCAFRPLGAFRRETAGSQTGGRRESGDWSTSTATPAEHRPQNYDPHFCVAVFCWRCAVGGHVPMAPVASRRTNAQGGRFRRPTGDFFGPSSAERRQTTPTACTTRKAVENAAGSALQSCSSRLRYYVAVLQASSAVSSRFLGRR